MRPFERSWQTRLVRKRNILPRTRDQGRSSTCAHNAVAGAIESAYKKLHALRNEDFNKEVSVEYLISQVGQHMTAELGEQKKVEVKVKHILEFIQTRGALTVEGFQEYKEKGDEDGVEKITIEDFEPLDPQDFEGDFVKLLTHILSGGIAIGVFLAGATYVDTTVLYLDVSDLSVSDFADGWQGGEYEYEYEDESEYEDQYEYEYEHEYEHEDEYEHGDGDGAEGDEEDEEEAEDDEIDENEQVQVQVQVQVQREGEGQEQAQEQYHAVLLISLVMDELDNLCWRVLDSHGPNAGEGGTRRIGINLIKEAHIITV